MHRGWGKYSAHEYNAQRANLGGNSGRKRSAFHGILCCIFLRSRGAEKLNDGCLVLLVFAFEISNSSVTFKVPDAGGYFVDQVFVMGHQ